jgi:hypothetical protein
VGLLGFFKEALNGFVHEELGVATEAKLVEFCDLVQVVFREGGEGTGSEVVGLNVESSFGTRDLEPLALRFIETYDF